MRATTTDTWINGASITITEPGLYMIIADCTFKAATVTGTVTRGCRISLGSTTLTTESRSDPANTNPTSSMFAWRYVASSTTITVQKQVSIAEGSAGRTYIAAKRIYKPL